MAAFSYRNIHNTRCNLIVVAGVTHYTFCESCAEYAIVENAYLM